MCQSCQEQATLWLPFHCGELTRNTKDADVCTLCTIGNDIDITFTLKSLQSLQLRIPTFTSVNKIFQILSLLKYRREVVGSYEWKTSAETCVIKVFSQNNHMSHCNITVQRGHYIMEPSPISIYVITLLMLLTHSSVITVATAELINLLTDTSKVIQKMILVAQHK